MFAIGVVIGMAIIVAGVYGSYNLYKRYGAVVIEYIKGIHLF